MDIPELEPVISQVQTRFEAIARPAFHTFWQTFGALMGAWWIASGSSDLSTAINDTPSIKRVALGLMSAVLASALSALKNTIKVYRAQALAPLNVGGFTVDPDEMLHAIEGVDPDGALQANEPVRHSLDDEVDRPAPKHSS